ncbi:MAG: hypothetical protein D6701_05020 [Gemmatimonadetes bacterium]|nr:MAG: hypothetical protein D6701_05020 [Gemmatimonadota bacterium]
MESHERNGTGDAPEDATLGGYFTVHSRPPAFEGADGHPYTVSLEVEGDPEDPSAPYVGYLVFPRWAATGLGIVGHVQTDVLVRAAGRDQVLEALGRLPLDRVKELLDRAVETAGGAGDDARRA